MDSMKTILIFTLVFSLLAGFVPLNTVNAQDEDNKLDSSTQTVSEQEDVYINNIESTKREQLFNDNWRFNLGDQIGAQNSNFDDSNWRTLNLPHDYSIEQEYSKNMEAESGYKPGGIAWYRKTFTLSESQKDKKFIINFDGVYMNSTTYINGHKLGFHPYGYTPYSYDITKYLKFGEENVISVKVDHKVPSSRWYSGSGIYRDVKLITTDKIHVDVYGTKVETPDFKGDLSNVNIKIDTKLVNDTDKDETVNIKHKIYHKDTNDIVGEFEEKDILIEKQSKTLNTSKSTVSNVKLWDLDTPNLYTIETQIIKDGNILDQYGTEYGFRYTNVDSKTGFYLNGRNIKLKGVSMHSDQGALGSRSYERSVERQIEILKEMGVNLIRVTHNPASEQLIRLANKHGMLVIDEIFDGWILPKNQNSNDYSAWFEKEIGESELIDSKPNMTWAEFDIKSMINKGKNDPSIIMWSLSNEVLEGTNWSRFSEFPGINEQLIKWAKEIDDTRYLTMGDNQLRLKFDPKIEKMADDLYKSGGVVGLNYAEDKRFDKIHEKHPEWPLFASETASSINSRGVYKRTSGGIQTIDKELTSYDNSRVGWGHFASKAWYDVITRDFVMGEAVWTGFDYLGEPTPWNGISPGVQGTWPSPKSSYFGIIDTAGFPKDSFYLYQSQWNEKVNTLHILPAWNENVVSKNISGKVPVVVYSDAASVELFITPKGGERKSLGRKNFVENTTEAGFKYQTVENETGHKSLYMEWDVKFEEGTLEAVAYDKDGNIIKDTMGRNIVKTTSSPKTFNISADRSQIDADGRDLSYITIDVIDENGNIVPDANNNIKVDVSGEGKLLALDNGFQADHQSYYDDNRNAYNGKLLAIVQSTTKSGQINVNISSDGLESKSITLNTKQVLEEDSKDTLYYTYSKNYFVKKGSELKLPDEVMVTNSDQTKENIKVTWDEFDKEKLNQLGSFTLRGVTSRKDDIYININVIDEIETLLNVSLNTPLNVKPTLPQTRPGVLKNGEVLDLAFPVEWEEIDESNLSKENIFEVKGKSEVLGKNVNLTATIRVQDGEISAGENYAPQALTIKENTPEDLTSDTLEAIIDESTTVGDNNEGGRNTTAWSNYNAAQAGITSSEIELSFATQQRFSEMNIHFWEDGYSASFPEKNTTKMYVSETGAEDSWKEVEVKETIGEKIGRVKQYKYSFDPIQATFVKIVVNNNKTPKVVNACTGITEIELNLADISYKTYESTEFESLSVDERNLNENELKKDEYNTSSKDPKIVAKTKENASLTILPAYENVINLILESEDQENRRTFKINLDTKEDLDTFELEKQIENAKNISKYKFTDETYNKLMDDLSKALDVLDNAKTQEEINQATENISKSIENLVEVEKLDNPFKEKAKIVSVDAGRKYFSVDDIKQIIDSLSENDYTHLHLLLGNDGMRYLLDDMTIEANGKIYPSDEVKKGIEAGNKEYGERKNILDEENLILTESEMDEIIEYANSKNIKLIPSINMPGHMDSILTAMEELGIENPRYEYKDKVSVTTLDLENKEVLEFTKEFAQKYIDYFGSKGVEVYNIGADEYANDAFQVPGWSKLIELDLYDDFINFVNDLSHRAIKSGMRPMAFNDGFYYNNKKLENATLNDQLIIALWTGGWWGFDVASPNVFIENGHDVLNVNDSWYYVVGHNTEKDGIYSHEKGMSNMSKTKFDKNVGRKQIETIGSMIALWNDSPSNEYEFDKFEEWIKTFATNNPDYFDLEKNKVDKSKLEELIKSIDDIKLDQKTDESVEELNKVLESAKEIFENEESTQEQVDEIATNLQESINNLVDKVNTVITINLVDKEENILKVLEEKEFNGSKENNLIEVNKIVQKYNLDDKYELQSSTEEDNKYIYNFIEVEDIPLTPLEPSETIEETEEETESETITKTIIVREVDSDSKVVKTIQEETFEGTKEEVQSNIKEILYKYNIDPAYLYKGNEEDENNNVTYYNYQNIDILDLVVNDINKDIYEINPDLDNKLIDKLGEKYKSIAKDIFFRYRISKDEKNEFETKQKVQINISELELKDNDNLYIYRIFDDQIEEIEYISIENNIVTFESDKFQTFVFATSVEEIEETESEEETEEETEKETEEETETEEENNVKNGIYEEESKLFYYEGDIKTFKGLFELDGSYYYAKRDGEIVTSRKYYVTKNNRLLPKDHYTFDEKGRIVEEESNEDLKNGIYEEEGKLFFYENGEKTFKGLFKLDGSYYFAKRDGELVTSRKYYVTKNNGLLPKDHYTFDEKGRIEEKESNEDLKNGIFKENGKLFFYENGEKTFKGLFLDNGKYYFAKRDGELVRSRKYYVTKTNGLLPTNHYTFDENGVNLVTR